MANVKKARGAVRVLLRVLLILGVVLAAGLGYLIYPGHPGPSRVMRFDGFVVLPRHGMLNWLDYLTVDQGRLFVSGVSSGAVFRVALHEGPLDPGSVAELPGKPAVHGVAVAANRNVAFVTRSGEDTVDVFDTAALRVLTRIPVATDPDAIIYDPGANLLYVASGEAATATLIDPDKRVVVGTVPLTGKPEFPAVDTRSGLLYQNLEDENSIAAIDPGKKSMVGSWSISPCEGPSGMAIDPGSRRLFTVCLKNALLVVFDLDQHRVVTTVPVSRYPDSVAIDLALHRIYVSGAVGEMSVIRQAGPDTYSLEDRISTHFGAHTLAVDPVSHRVYVGYAGVMVPARIAVFSPKP